MKKNYFILVILLIMVVGYAATQMKIDIKGNTTLSENTSDFNVYLANLKLNGTEIEGINETKDGYEINVPSKGTLEYDVINDSTEYDVEAMVECEEETGANEVTNFDYTGSEQTFTAPVGGVYKLETWGAQGGNYSSYTPGYGGYSTGNIKLNNNDKLYVNIGGKGTQSLGGYNGGGSTDLSAGGGGGATHIATTSGLLSVLEKKKDNILIVSGGGGGSGSFNSFRGGSAGGFLGSTAGGTSPGNGGTQTTGGHIPNYYGPTATGGGLGLFGIGGNGGHETAYSQASGAGGAGFYGGSGGGARDGGGGGGSSYIGNTLLTEKSMYCYNCTESTEESTKTISTTCVNSTPTENCAKKGNGYARITGINIEITKTQLTSTTIEAQDKLNKSVEVSNNGMTCSLKIKKISRTEKKMYNGPTEWTFDYTGGEQTFTAPVTGTYKLETWGAQGYTVNSYTGGYGGYSTGVINLLKSDNIYVFVGEKGKGGVGNGTRYSSYPNSLNATADDNVSYIGSGGGSTHIVNKNLLINDITDLNDLIMVSGGGGASTWTSGNGWSGTGGSGGGIKGNSGESVIDSFTPGGGGTQTSGGSSGNVGTAGQFGLSLVKNTYETGGGGGFYGGGTSWGSAGGGGSGYIGNSLLTEKSMYCYNCQESTEESTKTISTTCVSETPTENCAKSGNGYARITLIK